MTNQSELFRLASLIGCEPESEERHRQDLLDYITANYTPNSEIEQRERETRVDELRRIENANKNNGINFWFEDYPTNNGWATMMQYTQWRIAELKKAKGESK